MVPWSKPSNTGGEDSCRLFPSPVRGWIKRWLLQITQTSPGLAQMSALILGCVAQGGSLEEPWHRRQPFLTWSAISSYLNNGSSGKQHAVTGGSPGERRQTKERNCLLQMHLLNGFLIPVFLQVTSFSSQTLPIWREVFVKPHKHNWLDDKEQSHPHLAKIKWNLKPETWVNSTPKVLLILNQT